MRAQLNPHSQGHLKEVRSVTSVCGFKNYDLWLSYNHPVSFLEMTHSYYRIEDMIHNIFHPLLVQMASGKTSFGIAGRFVGCLFSEPDEVQGCSYAVLKDRWENSRNR